MLNIKKLTLKLNLLYYNLKSDYIRNLIFKDNARIQKIIVDFFV